MRKSHLVGLSVLLSCVLSCDFGARSFGEDLPSVTEAAVPFYPPLARVASVQGVVILLVRTNGSKVESIEVLSGHPLLVAAAESNVRTWTFIDKPPQEFQVTYRYEISDHCDGNPSVKMDFPSAATVCSMPSSPLD